MDKIRIQKLLAESGVASRRAVEEMIVAGRISVNGELVTSLPCFVDPRADEIRVDGALVRKRPAPRAYFLLNKPKGSVCAADDPQGRPYVGGMVPSDEAQRIYCVGGLDADTTGLVILTNDGELTQMLTHPKHGISRKYVAEIDGELSPQAVEELKKGVRIEGARSPGMNVRIDIASPTRSFIELELTGPQHTDIQAALELLGHKVRRLKRIAIGPLNDKGLKIGHYRPLAPREVEHLKSIAQRGGTGGGRRPTGRTLRPGPLSHADRLKRRK